MKLPILTGSGENLLFILIIVGIMGAIVLGVIIVKKFVKPLQIHKDDIPEEQAVKEELDRVLIPIDEELVEKEEEEKGE